MMKFSRLIGLLCLLFVTCVQAEKPVWTYATVPGFPPALTLKSNATATVKYTVTNQSPKTHTLRLRPTQGLTATGCDAPLAYLQSCALSVNINGPALSGSIYEGPVLCNLSNPWQCYQPSAGNTLAINVLFPYTITPSAGANGAINPNTPQKAYLGESLSFSATPNTGYQINQWSLDGNVVQTGGTTYQLTNINANHSLSVSFLNQISTVTPSAGANGTISPNTPQQAIYGSSLTFTATPNTGYGVYQWFVDGTLVQSGGTTYQLTNITANHTVSVSFSNLVYLVTPSAGDNGTISPNTPQEVVYGNPITFTATPNTGYGIYQWFVDGTLVQSGGTTYQLTNVTAQHTVSVSFSNLVYSVTPSAGANGTISPSTPQEVVYGNPITFTATPNTDYGVYQWFVDGTLTQTGGATFQLTNVTAPHNVNVTFNTVTLTPSIQTLALSVNSPTLNAALTGNARYFTITNNGGAAVTNVSVINSALPAGTTLSTTCGSTLNSGGSCTITITPGLTASSGSNTNPCTTGIAPVANTITVSGDGDLSTSLSAYILGYGCVYQGGFIFSIDDTTLNTGSISGKVVEQTNASPALIWSSNGQGGTTNDVSNDIIPGIAYNSTPLGGGASPTYDAASSAYGFLYNNSSSVTFPANFSSCTGSSDTTVGCLGSSDGKCDSCSIFLFYNTRTTNYENSYTLTTNPTPVSMYAVGLCTMPIDGYSDWYLPAVCDFANPSPLTYPCTTATQNMQDALPLLTNSCSGNACLSGIYWSSTEDASNPTDYAWISNFSTAPAEQEGLLKETTNIVRCARNLN